MHHEEIGGEGHELPVAVQRPKIGLAHDARQRGEGQGQEEPVARRVLVMGHVVQRIEADHHGHQTDERKEELGEPVDGIDEDAGQRQRRGQHHGPGGKPVAQETARAAQRRSGIEQPEGHMRLRMAHRLGQPPAFQKRKQFGAEQARQRHDQRQQHGGNAGPSSFRQRGGMGGPRFQQRHLHHMKGKSKEDQRTGQRQQHQQQSELRRRRAANVALDEVQASLRHEERRSAHAGHEPQPQQGPADRAQPPDAPQGAQRGREPLGEIAQGAQGQQPRGGLKKDEQGERVGEGGSGTLHRDAHHAGVLQRPPADEAFQVLALSHCLPGSEKEKKQSRHKKDGKTGHCGRYGHTRPGRWLPALSPRIPMRCTAFTLRTVERCVNGQENPFTSG